MASNPTAAAIAALLLAWTSAVAAEPAAYPRADEGDCRRPVDYIVETTNTELATALAQRYGELFDAERSGQRLLFRSRTGDLEQQRELERLAADPR